MNKKLYLLVLGAASLALQPVNARSQFTKKQVAKVVNTDVAISLATSIGSTHVPNIISVVKPADMPVVSFGSKKEDQLLGCDVIYNSDSLNVLPTRTFDEKGRLAYVKSPDGSYERYAYTEDQQGRTVSEDKYEHKASDEAGKETLLCSKTYGYDHLVGDDTDGKAYLMKEITYGVDYFSQIHYISKIKEYNWYEAGNCFVLTGQKNNIKVTGEFIEDYTTQLYAAHDEDTFTVGTYNAKYVNSKLEELKTQARTDVDAIINAVQAKKDYSAIADRVCKEEKKNIESAYKNIYDSYNDKYKTVSNLKISKFTASIADTSFRVDSDDGCPVIKVSIKLGYTYKIQYSGSDKANDKNNNTTLYIKSTEKIVFFLVQCRTNLTGT